MKEIKFTASIEAKPVAGSVEVSELPADLVAYMEANYEAVLGSDTKEIRLVVESKEDASRIGLYAAAWGKSRDPKLYVRKLPNGKRFDDNTVRLAVSKWDDVPAENRPGRRK